MVERPPVEDPQFETVESPVGDLHSYNICNMNASQTQASSFGTPYQSVNSELAVVKVPSTRTLFTNLLQNVRGPVESSQVA